MPKTNQKNRIIQVLLADPHHIVRNGIRREIETQPDMVIVGETNNGYEALQLIKNVKADIVILDIQLAGLNGVMVTRCLHDNLSNIQQSVTSISVSVPSVLVFSSYDDKQYVLSFLAAGAKGYLLKNEPLSNLLTGIRQVIAGQTILSQTVQTNLVELIPYLNQELSGSELKVIQMLAHGLPNREIAKALHISESTVKSHLNNTYRKIPWIRNRAEAISWAWINRIVPE